MKRPDGNAGRHTRDLWKLVGNRQKVRWKLGYGKEILAEEFCLIRCVQKTLVCEYRWI